MDDDGGGVGSGGGGDDDDDNDEALRAFSVWGQVNEIQPRRSNDMPFHFENGEGKPS